MSTVNEWSRPELVLVHEQTAETLIPALHPPSALYECSFDPAAAAAEQHAFVAMLRDEYNIPVATVRDVLMRAPLGELRALARSSIELDLSALPDDAHVAQREHLERSVEQYGATQLIDVCLLRPKLTIRPTATNTGFAATYEIRPLANLMFMRDQSITTARGRVLGHMASEQREPETALLRMVLRVLRQDPIHEVTGADARLEGGDFIPAGKVCFLGVGLRTNEAAAKQLLRAQVFGTRVVVLVRDAWRNQEEMHLDTYFNIAGPSVAVLCATRLSATPDSEQFVRCDVYRLREAVAGAGAGAAESETGPYELVESGAPFTEVLGRHGFTTIVPVPKPDQLVYGCNFLTLGPNSILLVKRGDGVSAAYKAALTAAGVTFREVPMTALTSEYGAAHCLTQVSRVAPPPSS